ncbi:SDR family NAD(P)-dependent oxidoreductase [Pseudomonas sp. MAP12]|uniref:SDR family NAD(P)-dependent oxidoreductase n=1 Tax=Geopseudomonas aromaticivorans TaxID=2849492 RepID=A0ABS6N0Q2_9GAMM|nr:SDR family NAD(P)-dependent oxidoreductase [Pseudomonas aromaticivorans]MBV2134633.1 SDR family NAD(P)-dependent oxidoreductase [Pseudomonas aromaticivorans]
MDPSPRSILITGCSSGIGLATARACRAAGWRVFASARRAEDVARLAAEGFEALALDLDDSDSIGEAVASVLASTGGRLDALFNNGGYGQPGAVEDLPRAAWREQFESNLFGPAELIAAVLPAMRHQGHGRILFNSSVLGYTALPLRAAYNASKFALEGLVDTLRLELAGSGIEAVLIEPGPIASRFRANSLAALRRHVDTDAGPHVAAYRRMIERLAKADAAVRFTLPAEAVAAAVLQALSSGVPRTRYPVTLPAKLFRVLNRLLPDRLLDRLKRSNA